MGKASEELGVRSAIIFWKTVKDKSTLIPWEDRPHHIFNQLNLIILLFDLLNNQTAIIVCTYWNLPSLSSLLLLLRLLLLLLFLSLSLFLSLFSFPQFFQSRAMNFAVIFSHPLSPYYCLFDWTSSTYFSRLFSGVRSSSHCSIIKILCRCLDWLLFFSIVVYT